MTDRRSALITGVTGQDGSYLAELARIVWQACGEDPAAFALEHVQAPEPDVQRRCPSAEKAMRLLGWEARIELEDGIAGTVRWLRDRHPSAVAR